MRESQVEKHLAKRVAAQQARTVHALWLARCMHCGSTDVGWVHTGVRWRLYDKDMKNPHRCARVADNNDFEDVSNA